MQQETAPLKKLFHCINISIQQFPVPRKIYSRELCKGYRLKITGLQLPGHMETMIVDLRSIYSTGPLLNVVYCGWMYALDLKSAPLNMEKQPNYTLQLALMLSCVSPLRVQQQDKTESELPSWNASIWFLFSFICHQSCMQVAQGHTMPLNSHYEFR